MTRLRQAGVRRGDLVGLAVAPDGAIAIAVPGEGWAAPAREVAAADDEIRPRWVTWSQETAQLLVAGGLRIGTCWDVAAVHRLLFGGWRADPGWAWARLRGLPLDTLPPASRARLAGGADLFDAAQEHAGTSGPDNAGGGADVPLSADGYLRPEWTRGGHPGPAARMGAPRLPGSAIAARGARGAKHGRTSRRDRPFGIDCRIALR